MRRWSLRVRMLLLSGMATLLALAIAAWFVAGTLERFVTQGVDQRLDAQLAVMATAVRNDGTIDRAALEQKAAVLSLGHDWRWQIMGPTGKIGSADFPTLDPGPPHPPPPPDRHVDPLPDGRRDGPTTHEGEDRAGHVHARRAVIETTKGTVTLIAAAPAAVIARPIRAALFPLLTVIALLAAVFALAAWLQLRLGLRPILQLRDQVGEIRLGTRSVVEENQPAELKPLAVELNALAADSAAALAAARLSAANLAHALKTPVATLALTVEENAQAAAQVKRIEGVIRHHLARARSAAIARRAQSFLRPAVADVVAVVGALYPELEMTVDVPENLAVTLDGHDLSEIVGNLLDNAARHARKRVAVSATPRGADVLLTIADDGPGIPADLRDRAMQPGIRLDEGPHGDGFGLSIVRDLVALHGGALELSESATGGLLASVTLSGVR